VVAQLTGEARHRGSGPLGGAAQRFDYFGAYSHFATDNDVPNNDFKNDTFVGRIGWSLGSASDISATVRHSQSDDGVPNGFDLFGVSDDSRQKGKSTYLGVIAQSQFTPAWHGVLRLASFDDDYHYVNPSPTGTPFDPFGFGANYLGNTVTIHGANGTSATGQAILDYGGAYPQPFTSVAKRRAASAQTTYQAVTALAVSAGGRFEHEEGSSQSGTSTPSSTDRDNYGAFLEARATLRRFYANAGLGYEHNAVFESAWTPRLSAALYLREPRTTGSIGDTKLVFNVGRGIKAPSIAQENSSLLKLVAQAPSVTAIVPPIGPERARTLDAERHLPQERACRTRPCIWGEEPVFRRGALPPDVVD
jgi:iron complex outermembrane receptor protein/vitamin B12 transporter